MDNTSPILNLLIEGRPSIAFLQMQNDLRDTDVNLEKYSTRRNNSGDRKPKKQQSQVPRLQKTQKDKKTGQHGTIFYSWGEVQAYMKACQEALTPTERMEATGRIRNIKGGDIFYAPQKNTDKEEWKIRPHIVYPTSNFKFMDSEGYKIYAIPLDGVHIEDKKDGEDEKDEKDKEENKKDSRWYTKLDKYIDYATKKVYLSAEQEARLSASEKEDLKHKMKDPFYADTGVLRHNIVEGRDLYAVEVKNIMNVKSTATREVMSILKGVEDKLIKERENLETSLTAKINSFNPFLWYPSKREKDNAIHKFMGDIYFQYQFKYRLPNVELFSLIKKATGDDTKKFDIIKEKYEDWQYFHGKTEP